MINKNILVTAKICGGELNPFDATALEYALGLGDNRVTVLTLGPLSNVAVLENLTRLGAKCILISDKAFAGSDTLVTAKALSKVIEKLSPDLIFSGRQSVDGDTAQVPPMLAEIIGYNYVSNVIDIVSDKFITLNGEVDYKDKTIYTFKKLKSLRFPSIFSKRDNVEVVDRKYLGLNENECGLSGSPTKVIKSYESNSGRRFCTFTEFDKLGELIKNELKSKKQNENQELVDKLEVIYYFGNVKDFAERVANNAIELKGKNLDEVYKEISDNNIQNVIFADDEYSKELSSRLAVRLNAGLCADCIKISLLDGKMLMTRPAFGGNITADIISTAIPSLATVRTEKESDCDVIFTIGNGAINRINEIKKLAKQFNAEVCATRTVVDKGIMPYTAQVGLTGKMVSPKVYVTFGVSGAVQHTSAIEKSGTIISLNVDKNARVFDFSDYGVLCDLEKIF